MQITVPSTIENNPLFITLAGVKFTLAPGQTLTVPDAVAEEFYRMVAAKNKIAPAVDLPFTDADQKTEIDALKTRVGLIEAALPELPDFPSTDGTYGLQLVMDDGEAALTWEAAAEEET